ncbi:zf-HC2 domain-containing protein [Frankia sp. AgPm24]|uniref:zf-HC2 domain-containing protein n=1 Tax=Frankia sp. AgPm24 TaxID=631128 RepID=UPI0020108E22|nr:zf-HC2 domain-containing protein [Frankia sp. AgPm24]MCK9921357.1 zf-HC2 domain-containing protein [Frankia sp. AgPm24]
MGCEIWREALSARIDGEEPGPAAALIDAHLDQCADCAAWQREAAALARAFDARPDATFAPVDLTHLAGRVEPRVPPLVLGLRWCLVALGLAQLVLAALEILGVQALTGMSMARHAGMADDAHAEHLSHESAAWNLAVGVGFLAASVRRNVAAGLVPPLGAFVVVLGLLCVDDLAHGEVSAGRLFSHTFLVAGYLIILALTRLGTDPGAPRASRADTEAQEYGEPAGAAPGGARTRPRLRLVPRPTSRLRRDGSHAA